jgi:transcriptional regulator with XRE-family HTH domain
MTLQEKIRKLRKQKGWSQAVLAKKADVTTGHINRLENGHFQPSVELLKKIAQQLDVTADYLLNEDEGDYLAPVKVEDKTLAEKIRLIETLEPEERNALIKIIDALLTKKKVVDLVVKETQTQLPAGS